MKFSARKDEICFFGALPGQVHEKRKTGPVPGAIIFKGKNATGEAPLKMFVQPLARPNRTLRGGCGT